MEPTIHDLEASFEGTKTKSQLDKIRKKHIIRVGIIGKKAYWVHENTFYHADIINGHIDNDGAKPINAYDLSDKELKMLLNLLDQLG